MFAFANPWFLAALPLAAVPVLIHLRRRRRTTRIVFPAAALLASSVSVLSRRWSSWETILLALRVALVAIFVIAMARPMVPSARFSAGRKATASVAIVIDDSPSMVARRSGGGERRIDLARVVALRVLHGLEYGSRVSLSTGGRPSRETRTLEEARALAERVTVSERADPLDRAVLEALAWLDDAPPPRELHVVSDFQASSWRGAARGPSAAGPPSIMLHDVGGELDDWALLDVSVLEPRVMPGMVFALEATVGANTGGEREVLVELDGTVAARSTVRLRPGETRTVSFDLAAPSDRPFVAGIVRLAGLDDWSANDFVHFAANISRPPKVLLQRPRGREGDVSASAILSAALTPAPGGGIVLAEVREAADLPGQSVLNGFDIVALVHPSTLEPDTWLDLHNFAASGGGVIIFADEGSGSQTFWRFARPVLPVLRGELRDAARPLVLGGISPDRAAIRGLGRAMFRRYIDVKVLEGVQPLAWFSGGRESPAILEFAIGDGRAVFLAAGLGPEWGDVHLQPAFVPFLHDTIASLARRQGPASSAIVGASQHVAHAGTDRGPMWLIDSAASPPEPRVMDGGFTGPLHGRGIYHVLAGDKRRPVAAVAARLDPAESDHARVDFGRIASELGVEDLKVSTAGTEFEILRSVREVTGVAAWLAFCVFLGELAMSAVLTRARSMAPGLEPNSRGTV